MIMADGKYDMLLVAEHDLYPPELDSSEGWHDSIFLSMICSYSHLSYNTIDGDSTPWKQYGGTALLSLLI